MLSLVLIAAFANEVSGAKAGEQCDAATQRSVTVLVLSLSVIREHRCSVSSLSVVDFFAVAEKTATPLGVVLTGEAVHAHAKDDCECQ